MNRNDSTTNQTAAIVSADDYTVDGSMIFHGDDLIGYVGATTDADGDVVGYWSRFLNQDTPTEGFLTLGSAVNNMVDNDHAAREELRVYGVNADVTALDSSELELRRTFLEGLLRNGADDSFGMNATFRTELDATVAELVYRAELAGAGIPFAEVLPDGHFRKVCLVRTSVAPFPTYLSFVPDQVPAIRRAIADGYVVERTWIVTPEDLASNEARKRGSRFMADGNRTAAARAFAEADRLADAADVARAGAPGPRPWPGRAIDVPAS